MEIDLTNQHLWVYKDGELVDVDAEAEEEDDDEGDRIAEEMFEDFESSYEE